MLHELNCFAGTCIFSEDLNLVQDVRGQNPSNAAMYTKKRMESDPGRFAAWSGQEKFRTGIRYVGQIDVEYKATLLEVCHARTFPRQTLACNFKAKFEIPWKSENSKIQTIK